MNVQIVEENYYICILYREFMVGVNEEEILCYYLYK